MLTLLYTVLTPIFASGGAAIVVGVGWTLVRPRAPELEDTREEWVRLVLRRGWTEGEFVDPTVHVVRTRDGWRACWGGECAYETVSTARLRVLLRTVWDEARAEADRELARERVADGAR